MRGLGQVGESGRTPWEDPLAVPVRGRRQRLAAITFPAAELIAGVATGAVIVAGVLLGVAGDITIGRLVGFLFLVTLFIQPVQVATEVQAQNAIAGMRRVLGLLDTPSDVADPVDGRRLPAGPIGVRFAHVESPTRGACPCCTTWTCRSCRAPGWRSSARPAAARPRSPSCSPG